MVRGYTVISDIFLTSDIFLWCVFYPCHSRIWHRIILLSFFFFFFDVEICGRHRCLASLLSNIDIDINIVIVDSKVLYGVMWVRANVRACLPIRLHAAHLYMYRNPKSKEEEEKNVQNWSTVFSVWMRRGLSRCIYEAFLKWFEPFMLMIWTPYTQIFSPIYCVFTLFSSVIFSMFFSTNKQIDLI